MGKRKQRDRLYLRPGRGYYMDLRDKGGGQRACIPEGDSGATEDRDEASRILAQRLEELESRERDKLESPLLREYVRRHLKEKAQYRRPSTVARDEQALRNVLGYFGEVRLSEIDVAGLTDYLASRRQQPGSRTGTTTSPQTLRNELHALSSVYVRAVAEGLAQINPVQRLPYKPSASDVEKVWLESGEAARLLEKAGEQDATPHSRAVKCLCPLLATFLLTGGRSQEVLGMLREDVDFEGEEVHFRANRYRTLKRPRHRRSVPLWPQLAEILRDYVSAGEGKPGSLLFPSPNGGMLSDIRGSLSKAVAAAGIEKRVTPHTLRHTYTAARLQTLDRGESVSVFTVMKELGHSSISLIERTYGHLSKSRVRSPIMEYREASVSDIRQAKARGA